MATAACSPRDVLVPISLPRSLCFFFVSSLLLSAFPTSSAFVVSVRPTPPRSVAAGVAVVEHSARRRRFGTSALGSRPTPTPFVTSSSTSCSFSVGSSAVMHFSSADNGVDEIDVDAHPSSFASLASSYAVYGDVPDDDEEEVWSLFLIEEAAAASEEEEDGAAVEGTPAIRALHRRASSMSTSRAPPTAAMTLRCRTTRVDNDDDKGTLDATVVVEPNRDVDDDVASGLVSALSRVLVQRAVGRSGKGAGAVVAAFPGEEPRSYDISEREKLATDLFGVDDDSAVETVDVVDSRGVPLGVAPRNLVHKFNLLHRGIGVVVSKDRHVSRLGSSEGEEKAPELYVHRRTDDKRIFPSLYDMFVGGVSTAGESARDTVGREIAEELGLTRAVSANESVLAGPLFKCTVCTSYNRCVVSVFSYACDSSEETITWQEEEVAWGSFVPYSVVETSAQMSIGRWKREGRWPGTGLEGIEDEETVGREEKDDDDIVNLEELGNGEWKEWDYVPDGLLVWEAWVRWRNGHN